MQASTDQTIAPAGENPFVFVVGCPRSGTTLLRRILDAHPMLAIPKAETHWIPKFFHRRIGQDGDGRVGTPLIDALLAHERFGKFGIDRAELEAILAGHPGMGYAEFVRRLFDTYGRRQGKALVGDKTPGYVRFIDLLHGLFPTAKFVHLVRDGRDVALSLLSWDRLGKTAGRLATFEQDPVTTTALFWEWLVRLGVEAGGRLPPGQYCEVTYESLVRDTAQASRRLCAFLDLPYDPAMLRFYEGRQRAGTGLSAKKAWLPPTTGLRDWRSQMPRGDLLRFEAATGELLDRLGYPRAHPEVPAGAVEHALHIRGRFSRKPHPRAWSE